MENLNSLLSQLYLIRPEISIASTLFLVVLIDLIFNKNKKLLPYIVIAGCLVTTGFIIEQFRFTNGLMQNGQNLFSVDPFGAYFKLLITLTTIVIVIFSLVSEEIKKAFDRHGEYYTLMLGMVTGMFVMVSASDLIMVYLSLELVSLSSYVLAGFVKNSLRSSEASLKYVIYGAMSSGLMLFGISLLFGLTGSTNMAAIKAIANNGGGNQVIFIFASILVFAGIGYKISAAPFHFWAPDVYEGAPVAITAYLSIASKAAGFALLIRYLTLSFVVKIDPATGVWVLVNSIDWKMFFVVISVLTMTLGNFTALWQTNMKRMLAYSSIAHAGYLLMGIAVLTNQGVTAILVYFVMYAFMNLGAFYVVMLISNKIGSEDLEDYKGIGYSIPVLGVTLAIFLVSLSGLPPTAGFIGKFYLFAALIDSKMITLAVIAILNSVVSLYYYIRVLRNMFLTRPEGEIVKWDISWGNSLVAILLAIPVILLGLYFSPLVEFAKNSIAMFGL